MQLDLHVEVDVVAYLPKIRQQRLTLLSWHLAGIESQYPVSDREGAFSGLIRRRFPHFLWKAMVGNRFGLYSRGTVKDDWKRFAVSRDMVMPSTLLRTDFAPNKNSTANETSNVWLSLAENLRGERREALEKDRLD